MPRLMSRTHFRTHSQAHFWTHGEEGSQAHVTANRPQARTALRPWQVSKGFVMAGIFFLQKHHQVFSNMSVPTWFCRSSAAIVPSGCWTQKYSYIKKLLSSFFFFRRLHLPLGTSFLSLHSNSTRKQKLALCCIHILFFVFFFFSSLLLCTIVDSNQQ